MNKHIEVFKDSKYYVPTGNLLEFRDWIDQQIKKIPEQYVQSASINIDYLSYDDDIEIEITVEYFRPETKEEEIERLEEERIEENKYRKQQLKQLEQLKKQLGIED